MNSESNPNPCLNGYIAFYQNKQAEFYAPTLWDAKKQAIDHWRVPARKTNLVHVLLAEKAGQPVVHTPDF